MKKHIEKLFEEFDENEGEAQDLDVKAMLVPYLPTAEVIKAFDDFSEKVREAIAISSDDWPQGRTLELSTEFALVPLTLKAKFGQE